MSTPPPKPWSPIEDLSDGLRTEHDPELRTLTTQWQSRKDELKTSAALRNFQQRLVRRWSVETGILERLYTLNEGVTLTLVELGFDAAYLSHGDSDLPPARLIEILEDHREAAEGLFAFVRQGRSLTESYIKELHQQLLAHQTHADAIDSLGHAGRVQVLKGAWKIQPNNPSDRVTRQVVHFYCPPEHVGSEMERLVAMHARHIADGVSFDIEAAWLHHRFTQIHPFQDGNGRVARALATLVCLRAGAFPLVVLRSDKPAYIGALHSADGGDLKPLVELFRSIERRAFLEAMSLASDTIRETTSLRVIAEEAKRRMQAAEHERSAQLRERIEVVQRLAQAYVEEQGRSFQVLAGPDVRRIRSEVSVDDDEHRHWFRGQISRCALVLGYFANLVAVNHWVHFKITSVAIGTSTSVIVAIHTLGRGRIDIAAVSAFVTQRSSSQSGDDADVEPWSVKPACDSPFTFDGGWDVDTLAKSFDRWLRTAIDRALQIWLDSL
ncbi:MAG: Fic family protein [Planctomycetes bacterium]|nr:Fic family protein [Planctomycetota bacterium]